TPPRTRTWPAGAPRGPAPVPLPPERNTDIAAVPTLPCEYCGAAVHPSASACGVCGRPVPEQLRGFSPAPSASPSDPGDDAETLLPPDLSEANDEPPSSPTMSLQRLDRQPDRELDPTSTAPLLAVVSPTGYRIEGLTVEQALQLLKGLGG